LVATRLASSDHPFLGPQPSVPGRAVSGGDGVGR